MAYNVVQSNEVPLSYQSYNHQSLQTTANVGDGGTGRCFFNLREAFTQARFIYGNYISGGLSGESTAWTPQPLTVSAQLEDPTQAGNAIPLTSYPLTFSQGQTSITVNPYTYFLTDPFDYDATPASQPTWPVRTDVRGTVAGSQFNANCFVTQNFSGWDNGFGFNGNDTSNYGNTYGVSAANNLLTSGASWVSVHGATATCFGPIAMLGYRVNGTPTPVVGIMGDSISVGFADQNSGGLGYIARILIRNSVPFLNLSCASEGLSCLGVNTSRYKVRRSLLNYCTHVIIQDIVNDGGAGGLPLATIKNYLRAAAITIRNRGAIPIAMTCLPNPNNSGLSNSYTQTLQTWNTVRVGYNDWLRGWSANTLDPILSLLGNASTPGVIDVCATNIGYEVDATNRPTLDGGRIYCGPNNNTPYSSDGLHPNILGNQFLYSQGAIPISQPATGLPLFIAPNAYTTSYGGTNLQSTLTAVPTGSY